jgi:hypothetical protein
LKVFVEMNGLLKNVVLSLLLLTVPVVASETTELDPVNDLQEAAFNYEYAAEAQESAADELLVQVRYLNDSFHEDVVEARRARIQAGKLQLRVAGLMQSASGNYANASRVWHQVAGKAGRDTASGQYFANSAEAASKRSRHLLRQAVELCEHAALGFADVEDYLNQASANQKAAGLREQLARR